MVVDIETREAVRARIRAAGFARVGFTGAEPVPDHVTAWVDAGRHASMEWMAREPAARADPSALMPDVRSVICVAAAYPATDAAGPIAGYARGEDYHATLHHALQQSLADLVADRPELTGLGWRICVDAQPLLERSLAARAGLGWIGKNTLLLDEEHGPWLLLAEILVNLEFPPDAAVADRCGTCTACLDACPTGALDDVRRLDANKCLSYWTIEHRGELPADWSAAAGHRVFGCDDCLTACPFPARPASLPIDGPYLPRADLIDPDLDDLEQRARESFRRHFGSTPLERARKGGLLRNIGHVRSNTGA